VRVDLAAIEAAFLPVLKLPMLRAGWAGDVAWFSFGGPVRRPSHRGGERLVGEYALHLGSGWRWITDSGLVRADENSSRDELAVLGRDGPRLDTITAFGNGGLTLRFVSGEQLEVSGESEEEEEESEYWRLFQPGLQTPHLVVSNSGADWHEANP